MRQDRDVAVTNDDQISALIPTEKRRTYSHPLLGVASIGGWARPSATPL